MKSRPLTIPELMLVAGTRGILGIGIGLLLAKTLSPAARTAIGLTLLTVGALSTVPLLVDILTKPVLTETAIEL